MARASGSRRRGGRRGGPKVDGFTLETVPELSWLKLIAFGFVIWIGMTLINMSLTYGSAYAEAMGIAVPGLILQFLSVFTSVAAIVSTWLLTSRERQEVKPNKVVYAMGFRYSYIILLLIGLIQELMVLLYMNSIISVSLSGVSLPLAIVTIIASLCALAFAMLYFYNFLLRIECRKLANHYRISIMGAFIAFVAMLVVVFVAGMGRSASTGIIAMVFGVILLGFGLYILVVHVCMAVQVFSLLGKIGTITSKLSVKHERAMEQAASGYDDGPEFYVPQR